MLPQLPSGESESIESGSPLETATPCQEDGAMENGFDGKTPENTVQVEDIWESPSHKAGAQGSTRPSQASVPEEDEKQNKKPASSLTKNLRPNDSSRSETTAHETGHQMQHTRTSLASKAPVELHDDDVWESPSQRAQGAQGSTRPSQASVPGEESKQAASTLTKNLYARYAARSEATADETGYQLQQTRTSLASKAPVERHDDDDVWESPSQRAQGAQGSTRPSQASVPGEESKQAASTLTKNLYAKYAARSQTAADETGYQLQHTRTSLASKAPVERHDDDVWESPSQRAQGAQGSTRPSQASVPGEESKQAASTLTKNLYAKYAARSQTAADETGYQLQQTRTSLASKAPVERHDDDVWESPSQRAQGAQGSTRPSQASVPGEESRQAASTLTNNLYAKYAARSGTAADETGYQLQHTRTSLASKAPVDWDDDDGWEPPSQRAQGAQGSTRPSQASVPGEESRQAASTLTKNLYAKYAATAADETGYQLQHTRTSLASKAPVEWDDDDGWEPPSQRAQGAQGSTRPSQASVPGEESKQAASSLEPGATVGDAAFQRTSVASKSPPGDAAEVDEAASEDEVFTKELLGAKMIHYSSSIINDHRRYRSSTAKR